MRRAARLAFLLALIGLCAGLGAWLALRGTLSETGVGEERGGAGAAPSGAGASAARTVPSLEGLPLTVRPGKSAPKRNGPAPTTGVLRIRVLWKADGSSVAGLRVGVYRTFARAEQWLETDAAGRATWEGAPPGSYVVRSLLGGYAEPTVEAGRATEAVLELEMGVTIEGAVVDAGGVGVADASVWLGLFGMSDEGFEVARTDRTGRFRVRVADVEACIGATARGRAPSLRQFVKGGTGGPVQVTLVLGDRGGALDLRVTGPDGGPVARAAVWVGSGEIWTEVTAQGAAGNRVASFLGETDEEGALSFEGLPLEEMPVFVRAPGCALARATATVRGDQRTRVDVRLEATPVVSGRVTDAAGVPVAGAIVRWEPPISSNFFLASTASADDGTYELSGLPVGTSELVARDERRGVATARLELSPGARAAWDPVVGAGLLGFRGRLVGEDGTPRVGWFVVLAPDFRSERPDRDTSTWGDTDAEGRFAIANLEDGPYRVAVYAPPLRSLRPPIRRFGPVLPGSDEQVFVVPGALDLGTVSGRVVREDGAPAQGLRFAIDEPRERGLWSVPVEATTGRFDLGGVRAGRYRIQLLSDALRSFSLGEVALAPGEHRDVGTIRLPAEGRLVVTALDSAGRPLVDVVAVVRRGEEWVDEAEVAEAGAVFNALPAGDYRLTLDGAVRHGPSTACTIRAGQETRVTLVGEAGVYQMFRVYVPADAPVPERYVATVRASDGTQIAREEKEIQLSRVPYRRLDEERRTRLRLLMVLAFGLAPGVYHVRVDLGPEEMTAETHFTVPATGDAEDVRLDARR